MTHWSFSLLQHSIQHKQQHLLPKVLQQLEAAFTKISATSGNFGISDPGGKFSAVAVKSPKPMPRFCNIIVLGTSESNIFWWSLFFDPCLHKHSVELLVTCDYKCFMMIENTKDLFGIVVEKCLINACYCGLETKLLLSHISMMKNLYLLYFCQKYYLKNPIRQYYHLLCSRWFWSVIPFISLHYDHSGILTENTNPYTHFRNLPMKQKQHQLPLILENGYEDQDTRK